MVVGYADDKALVEIANYRDKINYAHIRFENLFIISKPVVKYLAVVIDTYCSFKKHLLYDREKSTNVVLLFGPHRRHNHKQQRLTSVI